jgi:hypothetical protein
MNKDTSYRSTVVLPAVVLAMALLGACGNSGKKSTLPATAPVQASAAAVGLNACTTCHTVATADWLASRHANLDPGGLDSPGNPTLADIAGCSVNCHDPGVDSGRLVAGYTGNVPRPVVGCEACHGPGDLHAQGGGTGPIAFASRPAGSFGTASTIQVSAQFATCTNCHELLSPTDPASQTAPATATHDAGGSNPRVVAAGISANKNSITDTHFARPSDWTSTDGINTHHTPADFIAISGYAMEYSDEKACSNCHNPHRNATINREWAQSAHADRQGAKEDPSSSAPLGNGFFSSAWAHYNWSCDGTSTAACGGTTASPGDRRQCQRCHTTTGFIAYANAISAGDADRVTAIRTGLVSLVTYTAGFKPEMLKCNGCHADNRGTLRNPGPVTANYDFVSGGVTYGQSSHTYPDIKGSNVCMACHTGRENGDTIKNLVVSGTTITSFGNLSFINSHYLTAGGTIFRVTGYTFTGRDYANVDFYKHDKIGSPDAPDTGSNGPCIGCHMSRPNGNGNHIFLPVSRVKSGETVTITGIASEVCFQCHGPNDVLMLDLVREQRELFNEALEAQKDQLEKRGYFFADANPYFYTLRSNAGLVSVTTGSTIVTLQGAAFPAEIVGAASTPVKDRFRVDSDGLYYAVKSRDSETQITLQSPFAGQTVANAAYTIIGDAVKNWLTAPDTDATGAISGKNNMGAAFNFNLFKHDPGAYAHNRYYVKRLLYDSIDWLDDNQLNFSVGTTLTAVCGVAQPPAFCDKAKTYLLPNGVINGVAAERP